MHVHVQRTGYIYNLIKYVFVRCETCMNCKIFSSGAIGTMALVYSPYWVAFTRYKAS